MKIRYVIATSQEKAKAIANHAGYPHRPDAETILAMMKEGPEAEAAADYAIWTVRVAL